LKCAVEITQPPPGVRLDERQTLLRLLTFWHNADNTGRVCVGCCHTKFGHRAGNASRAKSLGFVIWRRPSALTCCAGEGGRAAS